MSRRRKNDRGAQLLKIFLQKVKKRYHLSRCGEPVRMEAPCLYIDKGRKSAVWNMPDKTFEFAAERVREEAGQRSFGDYDCRAARPWREFREKLLKWRGPFKTEYLAEASYRPGAAGRRR